MPAPHLRCPPNNTTINRDQGSVFAAPQFLGTVVDNPDELTRDKARKAARDFILTFSRDSVFPYRWVPGGVALGTERRRSAACCFPRVSLAARAASCPP